MSAGQTPRSRDDLADLLRAESGPVRLCGTGSRQTRLPPAPGATIVSLAALDGIEQLDAPDQTCSVGAGIRREALDEALHRVGLELPCAGGGSIGGLFATDPIGPTSIGGASPRSVLLGLEGVLADGTVFRSGSRVVKSVAGFDVHKLLVGSSGRLFAATKLHLRLRMRPRAEVWFRRASLDQAEALALFGVLRALPAPPAALHLHRDATGYAVEGRLAGRAGHIHALQRRHSLPATATAVDLHVHPPANGELLTGIVLPSRVPALLATAAAETPFVLHGGGRFELALPSPAATDAVLAALPGVPAQACIASGLAARRGRGTPLDRGQQHLLDGLKKALDPHGTLV